MVHTDEAATSNGLPRSYAVVKRNSREYVHGQMDTNGIESFWALRKRGYVDPYRHMNEKHLGRYVVELLLGRIGRIVAQVLQERCGLHSNRIEMYTWPTQNRASGAPISPDKAHH